MSVSITGTGSDTTNCYITYNISSPSTSAHIVSTPNDASYFSSSTLSSCILSGCTPGTTYFFTFEPLPSGTGSNQFTAVTTKSIGPPPTPPSQVSPGSISASPVASRSPKQMTVSWGSSSGATGYRLYKSSDGGANYFPVLGSDGDVGNVTSYTVTVDYEWRNYYFQVTATNAYGNATNATNGPFKSYDSYAPVVTSFFPTARTGSSISVYGKANDTAPPGSGDAASGLSLAMMYLNGSSYGSASFNSSGEVFFTYSGLSSGISYFLQIVYYDAQGNSDSDSITYSTQPVPFNWTYAKSSGASFILTAAEWTSLQSKINERRNTLPTPLGSYSFTGAFTGNNILANHYNEARNAIFGMTGSIPPYRGPGETIYASELNALRDALNSV